MERAKCISEIKGGIKLMDVKRNMCLLEEYKKKSYEELDKLEENPDLTETEMIIISVARAEKELDEFGYIAGIPMEEVFDKLLSDANKTEDSNAKKSNRRSHAY